MFLSPLKILEMLFGTVSVKELGLGDLDKLKFFLEKFIDNYWY